MFVPTRAAPSPPSGIPANHPFATYYVPPARPTSSITTTSIISKPIVPPSPSSSSRSTESNTRSIKTSSTIIHSDPLSNPRTGTPPRLVYTNLPSELAVFDSRPRQTLLGDLEYIIGKKLHFPLLSRLNNKSKESTDKKDSVDENDRAGRESERKVREVRGVGWDEGIAWDGVRTVNEKPGSGRKGRGVREGNWI